MIRSPAAVLTAVALPALAIAAGGSAEHHAPSIADLLWPVLNFSIFVFLLYRFVWPMAKAAVADRRRLIETEIREAERARHEATSELEEVRRLQSSQKEEGDRILQQLKEEGERERASVVETARRAAERIRSDARRLGEQEGARAALAIRRQIAVEATRRAADLLRQRLGDADQQRFLSEFVSGIAEAPR